MGKIAFVFAGQGAQYTGMGEEIRQASAAAAEVFAVADELRPGTSAQCALASKEELSLTVNTQPCLFAVDLAIASALRERGVVPEGVAGFSLGEIPALTFAGAFAPRGGEQNGEDREAAAAGVRNGFRLVVARGEAMNRAAEAHEGGMMAVMRLSPEQVEKLASEYEHVWPVNYNSPAQTVAAGDRSELGELAARVKSERGMAVPLAVSGAFHSPFMEQAADELMEILKDIPYQKPAVAVYANKSALPYPEDEAAAKAQIAAQVKSPVRWQETVEHMIADGFDTFVEVGPGKTLFGLIRKISAEVSVYNVENAEGLNAAAAALKGEYHAEK